MWNSIPFSEMDEAANPLGINQTVLQYSLYNTGTNSWSPITSIAVDGVATSYVLSSDSTGCYALVLEGENLFSSNQSLVEYNLQTGSEMLATSVANVTNIVYFDSFSHLAVLQQIDGSYQLLDLSSLAYVELPSMSGYTIKNVQFAADSSDTLGILYVNSASTIFSIFNISSNMTEFNMDVSQSTNYVNLIQVTSGYQIVTADASGITNYLIANQKVEQSIFYPMLNITYMGTTVTDQGTLVYLTENYGNSSNPLLNLSLILTANSILVAPSLSSSQSTVDQGQTVSLTSTTVTTGTSPYSYRWFSEAPGATSYSLITGATSAGYSFAPTASSATGIWSFMVQVTDNTGVAVNSTATTFTVNPLPTVSASPSSWTLDVGQSKTFAATPSGGSGTYTNYKWYVNGSLAQSGAASVMSFAPGASGSYSVTVTVTDSLGATSSLSSAATVSVNAVPTVSITPVGPLTLTVGEVQTFIATASGGSGTISYQWYLDGVAIGTNGASYSYTAAGTSHTVTCAATDSASPPVTSPTSNAVSITVNPTSNQSSTPSPTPTSTTKPQPSATLTPTPTASSSPQVFEFPAQSLVTMVVALLLIVSSAAFIAKKKRVLEKSPLNQMWQNNGAQKRRFAL